MKQKLRLSLLFIIFMIFLACSKAFNGKTQIRIPWPQKNGDYVDQYVPVGMTEIKDLSGPDAVFYMEPALLLDMETKRAELNGPAPRSKFIKVAENHFVPASFNTLNLSTVYAHIERLNRLTRNLGYEKLLTYPIRLGVNPKAKFGGASMQNNAAYISAFDSIFLFPFDDIGVPLSMNGGVLAHEYFHAIFQHAYQNQVFKLNPRLGNYHLNEIKFCTDELGTQEPQQPRVLNGTPCSKEELSDDDQFGFVLKAINEGLADVWAWIYTNDTDFMRHSFGKKHERRKLTGTFYQLQRRPMVQFQFSNYMRATGCNLEMSHNLLRGQAYGQGTNLGRFIIEHATQNNINRYQVGKRIVEALQHLSVEKLEFTDFINQYFNTGKPTTADECQLIKRISPDMTGITVCTK